MIGWNVQTVNVQMDSSDHAVWNHKLKVVCCFAKSQWSMTISEEAIQLDMDTY